MAPLQHPNLVGLEGGSWKDGPDKLCIVLEFCPNGDLLHLIRNACEDCLTWKEPFYRIMHGVALCFEYLHDGVRGDPLIHRDLKPANVMISAEYTAKVAE